MPVEDHEVHEKVKISADTPYGCHSRTGLAKYYHAPQRRYFSDGSFEYISIKIRHQLTTKCRNFSLWYEDPRCAGCTTEKDQDYADRMIALR